MTTGEIIKKYKSKKYKRDELASLLGISPQYLSNLISNKKNPSKKLINEIIDILEISADDADQIYKNEKEKKKNLKSINLKTYTYSSKGLSKLNKEMFLNNLLEKDYIFISLKEDFLEFKQDDILVFKKYDKEEIHNKYIIVKNEIYYCRKVSKNYILESYEAKMQKNIDVEYILLCSIRR